jgi:16S rRNA (uracil1498-N3)-methyltransferase
VSSLRTLLVAPPLAPGTLVIDGDEAHHARVVLRLRPGDDIRVADGAGQAASAVVTGVGRDALEIEVAAVSTLPDPPAARLTIACALPKGDRLADLVRSLTELGIGALQPLSCARGERHALNPERLTRISAEALKQCQRPRRLAIREPATLADLAADAASAVVLLDPRGTPARPGPCQATTLLIGPEGGWTEDEISACARLPRMRLASTILRIETAAVAAAAVWSAAWEAAAP